MAIDNRPCSPCLECAPAPFVPVCADPEYCSEFITDKCVIHKGTSLVNIGVTDGMRLDVILANIDAKILQLTTLINQA